MSRRLREGTGSVGARFIVFTVSAIVVFIVFAALATVLNMRRFSVRTVEDFSFTILSETNTKIENFLNDINNLAESLSTMRIVYEIDEPDLKNVLVSAVSARSNFVRAIYIGTNDGAMHEYGIADGFEDFEPTLPEDYDPRVRPWYIQAMDAGRFIVSDPYVYASEPVLGVTGALPVRRPDGELVGVLGIDLMLDSLRAVLWQLKIPKDGKAVLISEDGLIIASQYAHHAADNLELPAFSPELFDRIGESAMGHFEADYDGRRTVFSYTTVPTTGWILLLGLPYQSIVADADEVFGLILISIFVLLLLFLLGQSIINNKVIIAPLHELMDVIARLHEGDRTARARVRGEDEFSVLGREINTLADTVLDYTERMEEKVKARTKALIELEEENTRLRIVNDLHDTLGARLTNISICTSVAQSVPGSLPPKATEMLDRIQSNCREAMEGIKGVILTGRPLAEDVQLDDYLDTRVRRRLDLRDIHLDMEGARAFEPNTLSRIQRRFFRYVIDELVTNVLKHSDARRVSISLGADESSVRLAFAEDGTGFPSGTSMQNDGLGLHSIRERTEGLGGSVDVRSDGQGPEFVIRIPREPRP